MAVTRDAPPLAHVLLVGADRPEARACLEILKCNRQFGCTAVRSMTLALAMLSGRHVDVIVLDYHSKDHRKSVRNALALRARCNTPILVLGSTTGSADDRASVLLAGADDVVTQPSNASAEFIARVSALSRRSPPAPPSSLRIGRLEIDLRAERIGSRAIGLTRDQRNILAALASRSPGVVAYAELAKALGYGRAFSTRAVREAVRRLRIVMTGTNLRISTVFGVGYRAWDGEECAR